MAWPIENLPGFCRGGNSWKVAHDRLRRNQDKHVLDEPFDVITRLLFGALERVRAQVEQLWRAQRDQWLHPHFQIVRRLFHKHRLILIVTQSAEIAIVGRPALVRALAGEQIALIVNGKMHLEALAADESMIENMA
jgi:hypothetical protein